MFQNKKNITIIITCFLLSLIIFFLYAPVMEHDFTNYDDADYVTRNYFVKQGFNADSIRWAFFSLEVSNWHPVTWLSHMADCQLWGLDPGKHHLTSLVFHIINTLLLFFVFLRATGTICSSAIVAAFFAFHPMHIESVAWIAERKDLLCAFFMNIALIFYISWAKSDSRKSYWAAVVSCLLGLMSKPMIVTLPFLLLVLDYWPLGRLSADAYNDRNGTYKYRIIFDLVIEKIPFFILTALSCAVTVIAQKNGGAINTLDSIDILARFCNSVIAYFKYILKLFYPLKLAVFYPYPDGIDWPLFVLSLSVLAVISIAAVMNVRKHPYFISGWLWFTGTLVPVIGLVQVGAQSMADRYTYIPYTGLFFMIVFGINGVLKHWKYRHFFVNIVFSVFMVFFLYLSHIQIPKWQNSITLFQHAINVTENNAIAYSNLGEAFQSKRMLKEAMHNYSEAIRIDPSYAISHYNLGVCYTILDDNQKALKRFLAVIGIKPDFGMAYYSIGSIYLDNKEYDKALRFFIEAVRLMPNNAKTYYKAGLVYAESGDNDKALLFFRKAESLGYTHVKEDIAKILGKKMDNEAGTH